MLVTVIAQQTLFSNTYQNKECTLAEVQDDTGSYDVSSNPTGYGAPNYAAAAVDNVVARILQPNATSYVDFTFDGTTTPTAVQITTAAENTPINTFILGETTEDDLGQLLDGTTDYIQIPFFDAGLMLTFTQGERTGTGALLTSAPHAGMNYIKANGTIYGITITGAGTFTIDADFADTSGAYAVQEGFGANIKLLTSCQNDSCMARKNGEIAAKTCGCDDRGRQEFLEYDAILEGAKDLFFCEAYAQCQKAMDAVTNYCNDEGCEC